MRHDEPVLCARKSLSRGLIDTTLARGTPELFLVEEEYRLALLAAEITFVEEFIAKITDTQSGWGAEWARFHDQAGRAQVS